MVDPKINRLDQTENFHFYTSGTNPSLAQRLLFRSEKKKKLYNITGLIPSQRAAFLG